MYKFGERGQRDKMLLDGSEGPSHSLFHSNLLASRIQKYRHLSPDFAKNMLKAARQSFNFCISLTVNDVNDCLDLIGVSVFFPLGDPET